MGREAKRRGTREQRIAQAIARREHEHAAKIGRELSRRAAMSPAQRDAEARRKQAVAAVLGIAASALLPPNA